MKTFDIDEIRILSGNVRGCTKCSTVINVPQPGYYGEKIGEWCVLIVGQNPGVSRGSAHDNIIYNKSSSIDEVQNAYGKMLKDVVTGKFVSCLLKNIDSEWSHLVYTNMVKCPTQNNRELFENEINNCIGYLHKQFSLLNPVAIVLMGSIVTQHVLGLKLKNTERKVVQKDGYNFIPIFHYSYLMRTGVSFDGYCEPVSEKIKELLLSRKNNLQRFFDVARAR